MLYTSTNTYRRQFVELCWFLDFTMWENHLINLKKLKLSSPHYHQTRSTAGWQRGRWCVRRHRCCCTSPHIHSLENTPWRDKSCYCWVFPVIAREFILTALLSYRHSGSQQRAGWVRHVPSFSFILHQEVCSPAAAVRLPFLLQNTDSYLQFYFLVSISRAAWASLLL